MFAAYFLHNVGLQVTTLDRKLPVLNCAIYAGRTLRFRFTRGYFCGTVASLLPLLYLTVIKRLFEESGRRGCCKVFFHKPCYFDEDLVAV